VGEVMSDSNNYKDWIIKAGNDFNSANKLIMGPDPIIDTACYHCQQASEKYLKAYLIYKNIDFDKTHDLNDLKDKCPISDKDLKGIDFKNMNSFAVDIKYPGEEIELPSLEETKEYLGIAKLVKEIVENKIQMDINKTNK
jgi:HEPN domain-containing protein